MGHPTEGVLRRLLDEPAAVATLDRQHVAGCEACSRRVVAVRADAELVGAALTTTSGQADADVDAAWRRLAAADPVRPAATLARRPAGTGRVRTAMRRPVVATVAVAIVLTGAGAAAANDWLQIFRTEEIVPVALSPSDLNALPDLRKYGDVRVTAEPDVYRVADARAATAETGLDVPQVRSLPRGVSGEPDYQAGGEASLTFTFSGAPGLEGSRVRLVAGPGVAAVWTKSGIPVMVVGRAVAPRAFSDSGVPFEVLRDHLLTLPGFPPNLAASLRTFNYDGSTLPLPVPEDRFTTSSTQVNGEPATVLATRDRTMAAVMWVEDGVVTVVAGTLDTDEVLAVARGLR